MEPENYLPDGRPEPSPNRGHEDDRREFLVKCGRFAAYATPAILLILDFKNTKANAVVS